MYSVTCQVCSDIVYFTADGNIDINEVNRKMDSHMLYHHDAVSNDDLLALLTTYFKNAIMTDDKELSVALAHDASGLAALLSNRIKDQHDRSA